MRSYREVLEEQVKEIESLEKKIKKNAERRERGIEGKVKISNSHGNVQYYVKEKGQSSYHFVPKAQWGKVRRLAQINYEQAALKCLEHNKKAISNFLKQYQIEKLEQLYDAMPKARKALVNPVEKSYEDRIKEWMEENPGERNTYPMGRSFVTERGEVVRSKSEKIIADKLYSMGIPYQYEPRLELVGYHTVYPDFVAFHKKEKRSVYIEHLGLVDDKEYAQNNLRKIEEYERSGLLLGRDLILTMETMEHELDVKLLEEKLQALL